MADTTPPSTHTDQQEQPPTRRTCCLRCQRPPRVCYCTSLPTEQLQSDHTYVLILQHPHEKRHRHAISSVPVLTQVLKQVTVIPIDGACPHGQNEELDALLYNDDETCFDTVLVLFPDANAKTLTTEFVASFTGELKHEMMVSDTTKMKQDEDECTYSRRFLLMVIDGTWIEAKKILHHNRQYFDALAARRGPKKFQYVCLDSSSAPQSSLYGDVRREPIEGCMSTLEAVASALKVLEPVDTGKLLHDALLEAFQGMILLQEQCMIAGRAAKLKLYGGVTKQQVMQERKQQQLQQQQQYNHEDEQDTKRDNHYHAREYVLYTTHTDFRQRKQLLQHGQSFTCMYDEARTKCQELNQGRKRGNRLAVLPIEVFRKQQQLYQQQAVDE